MAMMKFKNSNGEWMSIPAFKGEPGKDGAVQYKAGDGIKIENDTITAEVTKDYVDDKLEDLGEMGFTPEIAESLPTENIDEKTIYMIPSPDGKGDNIYEEWMYINNKWEMIGSTSVDLTDYYTKDVVDGKIANVRLESEDIPIYHIYGEKYVSTSMNTISTTSDLGVKITEVMQQIYNDRDKYRTACIIWHNTHVQAPKPTLAIKTYIDSYNLYSTSVPEYTSSTYYTFKIMDATISNGVISWSNNYNAVVSHDDVLQSSSVLTKNNSYAYTPTNDYNPATKKYVDDECLSATKNTIAKMPIELADKTFQIPTGEQITVSINYTVENISTTYGFALNASGFYESDNKGKSSTYALCKVTFNLSDAISLPITLINNGEAKYDYGIFSEIDKELRNDNTADTTNVFRAYNGANDSSTNEQTLTYNMPAGQHFIYIKYRKDNSTNNFNDSLQFKIPAEITSEKLKDFTFASTEYVSNALTNIPQGSGDVKGFYHIGLDLGEINTGIDWTEKFLPVACLPKLGELINKIIADGVKQPIVVIENTREVTQGRTFLFNIMSVNHGETNTTSYHFQGIMDYVQSLNDGKQTTYDVAALLDINGEMVDGNFEIYNGENTCLIQCASSSCLTLFNELEFTPTGDYNPATKKYVDDVVANIDIPEVEPNNIVAIDIGGFKNGGFDSTGSLTGYVSTDENVRIGLEKIAQIGANNVAILIYNRYGAALCTYANNYNHSDGGWGAYYTGMFVSKDASNAIKYVITTKFSSAGAGQNIKVDASDNDYVIKKNVLTTTNTTSYTPTANYHPATKKYVDDAVAGVSGGITSESDPIFSASEAAKITSTDTANWNSKVDINAVNNAINTTLSGKSYLTSESDPTVPAWAKAATKPTYTASEVGALPASTVIPTVPTKLSGFTDDLGSSPKHTHSQYLTSHQDISGKQNKVLYGIADPTSDIGTEGDIYVKYV